MDPVKILEERISHEIDIAEKKFNNHVHRKISGMTNKNIHERDNI